MPTGKVDEKEDIEIYKERILQELEVIEDADLSGYFLIVADYVNEFRRRGVLVGPGRGSAAGCLISYLIGITLIDPIEYGLIFSRFFNSARKGSLPDIDVDFPPDQRENVIIYLKEKYGEDRVCQMLTFGRLQGRSALKEVLRVNESCSFDQMNDITNKIPQEAAISDKLEEMDEPSVIRWALENDPDTLREYCWEEDGELHGDFARDFAQALRIEGTFKTQGKHAAGVVVSSIDLNNLCPMVKETRGNEKIAGMEMGDLEAIGKSFPTCFVVFCNPDCLLRFHVAGLRLQLLEKPLKKTFNQFFESWIRSSTLPIPILEEPGPLLAESPIICSKGT